MAMPEDSIVPNGGAHGGQEASHAPDAPGYLALKLLFFTPKRGDVAGGACTIYEGATGETILQTFCLTRSVPSLGFKPTEGWRTFNKLVSKIGPYDRTWGDKIEAILPDLFPDEDRIALFDEARSSPPSKEVLSRVEGKVLKGIERATHCTLSMSCAVELLRREQLEEASLLEPKGGAKPTPKQEDAPEAEDGEEKSFEGTVIPCIPRLDPVWGKSSTEVVPGDLLEVGLAEGGGPSGLVMKYLESTGQSPIFPVEEVDRRDNKTYIYLRISEELQGLLTLTKDLRLKTKRTVVEEKRHKSAMEDMLFFGALGLALVGLLLALRYLFFA